MKFKILSLSTALLPLVGYAFEINTHQAITVCALSNKCIRIQEQQGAQNLNHFAQTLRLSHINYKDQVFEKYDGKSYLVFAERGEGLGEGSNKKGEEHIGKQIGFESGKTYLKNATDKDGNIIRDKKGIATNLFDYSNTSYISLLEAGSILEDALFPDATTIPKVRGGDGRFNNHFYSAQFYLGIV